MRLTETKHSLTPMTPNETCLVISNCNILISVYTVNTSPALSVPPLPTRTRKITREMTTLVTKKSASFQALSVLALVI